MLSDFLIEELPYRICGVQTVEKAYVLATPGAKGRRDGVIDLVTAVEGVMSAVRFAVVDALCPELSAELQEELSDYLAVEPRAQQAVACVFVTAEEGRIVWHRVMRHDLAAVAPVGHWSRVGYMSKGATSAIKTA